MKKTAILVQRIPLTQARINLGKIVRRAHLNSEYFILEKDGIPVAGLMDVAELEDYLELQDPKLRKQITEGYAEYRRGQAQPARKFLSGIRRERLKRKKKS